MSNKIWLLGGLRVASTRGPERIVGAKTRSVFAYLALLYPLAQSRDLLAEIFWPETTPQRARHNLANTLYQLRRTLQPGWLALTGDLVALQPSGELWVDVLAFEQFCADDTPASLAQAVDLYSGELLPELYDDWLLPKRAALHEHYLSTLLRLGQLDEQHGRHEEAIRQYRRLIQHDPLHEQAYEGLMRNLGRMGKLREALAAYGELETTLELELHTGPGQPLQAFAAQLRGEMGVRSTPQSRRPSFVGRVLERSTLLARIEQAETGHGGILAVLGEAGSGKSRLLEELAGTAGWRGWQVAWGHCQEFTLPAPYTPLAQALAQTLAGPRLHQIRQIVQPLWLALLAGLVPQISTNLPPPQLAYNPNTLPIALQHLLAGLQQIGPHLLILDDVQWADPSVWPLLRYLQQPLADMWVLLVVSGRSEELTSDSPAWATLASWEADRVLIRLDGLSLDELQELAAACGLDILPPRQLAQLHLASAGNPLLALGLIEGGLTGDVDPLRERPSIASLMQRRLERISPQARAALDAAAVLGYRFGYEQWQALEQHGVPLAGLTIELERAGLIELEGAGYRFAHDTLRACVYAWLTAQRRRALHSAALQLLASQTPGDTLVLLQHADQAAAHEAIGHYALLAGEQALASFLYQTAAEFFTQALEQGDATAVLPRYQALYGRTRALAVLGDQPGQQRDIEQLAALAEQLDDDTKRAEVAGLWAELCRLMGEWSRAQSYAERARELALSAGDLRQQARILELLARVAQHRGGHEQAQEFLEQARTLYISLGDPFGEVTTIHNLATVAWALGEHQAAIERYTAAIAIFHQLGDRFNEARARNSLGCAEWGVGAYRAAYLNHQQALSISVSLHDRWGEGANTLNLGHIALVLGDYVAAVDCFDRALACFRSINYTYGIAVCLSNLGNTYRALNDTTTALGYCQQALELSGSLGYRRVEGYAHYHHGLALLQSGATTQACAALETACAIRTELSERDNSLESQAGLALALLANAAPQPARLLISQTLLELAKRPERPVLCQWVHFVAYQVFTACHQPDQARQHLCSAAHALEQITHELSADQLLMFTENIALNRQLAAALEQLSERRVALLVRADVPLGSKLAAASYISITWTISAPTDAAIADPAQRRRHVLARLLKEATDQGAAPTDADLAAALGVSRRTVLRDMQQLLPQDLLGHTRGRSGA